MAQQSLYRRYRPRRFGEVKGQEHVVRALLNAVATDTVGHAYLFSGPRGTGKTSTARILAKALNCTAPSDGEPCCECDSCLSIEAGRSFDLFELDAASNNGVDAIRDLVERSAVGSPGRTKVYILDEVHMLSGAASNALLKTLEEPPEHVRFVLATTDPQKVLPTIRSRTQHFEFHLLPAAELEAHVRWVVRDAGLDVDDEGIAHAVRQGRGSVRDALSALDQIVAAGGVVVRAQPTEQLFAAVAGADTGAAIVAVAEALALGHDPRVLGEAFLSELRDAFLLSLGVDTPHMVDTDHEHLARWASEIRTAGLTRAMERIGEALVDMRSAPDPRVPLEVALVQLTMSTGEGVPRDEPVGPTAPDIEGIHARLDRLEAAVAPTRSAQGVSETPASADVPPVEARPQSTESRSPSATATEVPSAPGTGAGPAAGGAAAARSALAASRPGDGGSEPSSTAPRPTRDPEGRSAPPPPPPRRRGSAAAAGSGSTKDSAPGPSSPTPSARTGGQLPDRDALVMGFGDAIVPQLKGIAKAIYAAGRFVAVTDGRAVFSLDNAPTRDRAEKYRTEVEALLERHFGTPVPLRLVTEADATSVSAAAPTAPSRSNAAPTAPSRSNAAPTAPSRSNVAPTTPDPAVSAVTATATDDGADEAELITEVDQLEDADVSTSGVDKLSAAFPGAELIESEEASR